MQGVGYVKLPILPVCAPRNVKESMLRPIVVLLVLAVFSAAQTPDSATIRGQVLDQTHAAIPGVEIKVKNTLTAVERNATSDATGRFSLSGLPVGSYTL